MSNNILKIGWVLVLNGIISREQLEKALSIQKLHPTKSVGEIVSKLFNIPEGEIEAIFVREVLVPTITECLYAELRSTKAVKGAQIKQLVPTIDVIISKFQRNTNSSKIFTAQSATFFQPSKQKSFLSTIDATIERLELKTTFNDNIKFNDVTIEYNIQNQTVTWLNPAILLEAKVRLNQILKRKM